MIRTRSTLGTAALALSTLLAGGCGPGEAALLVDGATFSEDELLGLRGRQVWKLAEITALGLAYAGDEVERLGRPLLERRIEDRLLERFRAELAVRRVGVEEDVLRAQYETDPRYELVVRHVVALAEEDAPEAEQDSARARARRALERIEDGEPLSEVAADLSDEPGAAERGGRLEPGRRGSWVPEFWETAIGLEEGEHSDVVRTRYGYHVIELEERRTVPFEEVRGEVVLDAAEMIGGVEEVWSSWRDSVAPELQVDTAAVEAAARGRLSDTAAVVRWPGGAYRAGSYRSHLNSLPVELWREASTGTGEPALREAREDALRARAAALVRQLGMEISEAERSALQRQWSDQVTAWATSLGFEPGMGPSAVAAAAREGLSTTRQNARIARREMEERAPLLRAAYPIRGTALPETGGTGEP